MGRGRASFGRLSERPSGTRQGVIQSWRDAAARELGPRESEGTRSEAAWSPLLPLRPGSLPTLPGGVTAPIPSGWSSLPRSEPWAISGAATSPARTPIRYRERAWPGFPFRTTFLAGGWIGGQGQGGAVSIQRPRPSEPAQVPVLGGGAGEHLLRPQEAHQARGPALLLESSPKHGEGTAYFAEQVWPDSFSGRKFRGQRPWGGRVTPHRPIKASSCCTWPRPDSAPGTWPGLRRLVGEGGGREPQGGLVPAGRRAGRH